MTWRNSGLDNATSQNENIESPGKKAVPVNADTVFAIGDKLTVFGNYSVICKAFHARERFADE